MDIDIDKIFKPNVSEEMAVELIQTMYGLEVTNIKSMVSFNDQNFRIHVSKQHKNPYIHDVSDDGYTFKIVNTMKSSLEGHIESMHSALNHLNGKGLRVPVPVPNLEGSTWKLEKVQLLNEDKESKDSNKCGIHLVTFLPGIPLNTIEITYEMLFEWGAMLAQFHNATEDLICANLKKKPIFYNLDHVLDIRSYMDGLPEEHRNLAINILDKYESNIKKCLDELPKGFLHGDFNGYNVLAREELSKSGSKTYVINGILDFEDMHFGTYVWDIGLMLAHMYEQCTYFDPVDIGGHSLAGYLSRRSLSDTELSFIKMCIECRLSQTLVLCAYSGTQDPTNPYIAEWSSGDVRYKILKEVSGISDGELHEKWQNIFQLYSKSK